MQGKTLVQQLATHGMTLHFVKLNSFQNSDACIVENQIFPEAREENAPSDNA